MKIGFRTVKTALGVSIAILLAQSLNLEYFTASGILTLLCIQRSRRQSTRAVSSRFFACLISLFLSSALFELIGYQFYSFLILLLMFIPLCVRIGVKEGIASSSVIVMHVYMHAKPEWSFFWNEFLVILIGLGVALLVNWYMPSSDKELKQTKEAIDGLVAAILNEIALFLKEGSTQWDGKEVLQLGDTLRKARALAVLETENMMRKDEYLENYLNAKQQQYDLLKSMLPSISRTNVKMEQGMRIGEFVQEISKGLTEPGSGRIDRFCNHLHDIREYHKLLPLPVTRDEFENRASLYAIANDLERFLAIEAGARKEKRRGKQREKKLQPSR
ncbi:aromatic acid exporter family protein [Paenibacillus beijingensis]|uniref:aromatic acid exporter family protein n=1 Tax=Paenibacillus beijingensis TaxID=1126833 RepID=UPI000697F2D6|nr:aromatic acid exporter family protein [Paenibacillus beijingensis]